MKILILDLVSNFLKIFLANNYKYSSNQKSIEVSPKISQIPSWHKDIFNKGSKHLPQRKHKDEKQGRRLHKKMILSQHFNCSPSDNKIYEVTHASRTSQSPSYIKQNKQMKGSMLECRFYLLMIK